MLGEDLFMNKKEHEILQVLDNFEERYNACKNTVGCSTGICREVGVCQYFPKVILRSCMKETYDLSKLEVFKDDR